MWCKQHILSCKHQAQLGTFLQLHHTDDKNRERSSKDWDITHRAKCLLQGMYKCSHPCIQQISAQQINAQAKRQPAKSYEASSCMSRYATRLSTAHKSILKKKKKLFWRRRNQVSAFLKKQNGAYSLYITIICVLQCTVPYIASLTLRALLSWGCSLHQVSKEQPHKTAWRQVSCFYSFIYLNCPTRQAILSNYLACRDRYCTLRKWLRSFHL